MINYQLNGKVAVITGGASGIGLACAQTLARSGAGVSIWDLSDDALEAAVASLTEYGQMTHRASVDVADSASVDAAMEDVAKWHLVIRVNLDGVFLHPAGWNPRDEAQWWWLSDQHGVDSGSGRFHYVQRLRRRQAWCGGHPPRPRPGSTRRTASGSTPSPRASF